MWTVRGLKHESQVCLMLLQKFIQFGRGMGRGIVQHHNPEDLWIAFKQAFEMRPHFLMPFSLMDGIHPSPVGYSRLPNKAYQGLSTPGDSTLS